ncbi:MAG: hypothetical protein KH395_12330 [Bacteroides sp.]|nr:hypothetical protein [Bacteroides sp.]
MGAYIFAGALVGAGELLALVVVGIVAAVALVVRWIDDIPDRRERRRTGESRLEQAQRRRLERYRERYRER